MKRLLSLAALALVACSAPDGAVELSDVYIMEPLDGRDMTAGYFTATNTGADARIVGASSPVARAVELHTHEMDGDRMAMRKVDGVDVSSGEMVVFEPRGLHLMMFGVELPDGATEAPVTLRYADGTEVTVIAELRAR